MDGVPESAAELVGVIQATGGGSRERVLADAIRRATAGRDNFSILVAGCLVEFRTGHYWTRLNYAKFGAFVRAELSFGVRAAQLMIRVYRVRVTERH